MFVERPADRNTLSLTILANAQRMSREKWEEECVKGKVGKSAKLNV